MMQKNILKDEINMQVKKDIRILTNYISAYIYMKKPVIDKVLIEINQNKFTLSDLRLNRIISISNKNDELLDWLVFLAPNEIEIHTEQNFYINKELINVLFLIYKDKANIYYNTELIH